MPRKLYATMMMAGLGLAVASAAHAADPSVDQLIKALSPTPGVTRGSRPVVAEPGQPTPKAMETTPTTSTASAPSASMTLTFQSGSAALTPGAMHSLDKLGAALSSASVGDSTGSAGLVYTSGGGTATSTLVYTPVAADSEDLSATSLTSQANAETALTDVYTAVTDVAAERGYTGAQINTLNAVSGVESTQETNVTSAENSITQTDYGQASSNLSKYEILSQTGISALAQANSVQQEVLKLLQ